MEFLASSGLLLPLGLAVSFWLVTTKKFRKDNGEVVSQYVSKNLRGLSDTAQMSNELALLEFEAELKEYGVSLTESSKKLKEWQAYHSTKGN
jgi:hypothetical protein